MNGINVNHFCWARSDDAVHYKSDETVNFFAGLDVQLLRLYRFYKLRILHLYL